MLDDRDLAEMRDAVAETFPDLCNLLSVTTTADNEGGYTETWGTATANVPCRKDLLSGNEVQADNSSRPFATEIFSMPCGVAIASDYRIEFGDNTYAITNIKIDSSWNIVQRVYVERV